MLRQNGSITAAFGGISRNAALGVSAPFKPRP